MGRRALLLAVMALALVPVALAANPKSGTYKGTETKSVLTVSKGGKTASLRVQAATLPAGCRLAKPVVSGIKIKGGAFAFKGSIGKIAITVKGEFPTDYLSTITVTLKGRGCNGAFSDALARY